jgi:hypothetical protein
VGGAEATGTAAAEARGWSVRVMERDGEDLMGTMDMRADRINLKVDAGRITGARVY